MVYMPKRGTVPNLVDTLLLLQKNIDQKRLHRSVNDTFARRATHQLPEDPPEIPNFWKPTFDKLAGECQLFLAFEEAGNVLTSNWKRFSSSQN